MLASSLIVCAPGSRAKTARANGPELFIYEELVQLYEQNPPPPQLSRKLSHLLSTPFVSNQASARGVRPLKPNSPNLGKFLRVACWNIERGLEFEAVKMAFAGPDEFSSLLDETKYPPGSRKRALVLAQATMMKEADVIVLNEADWGLKRTGYRNVVEELASVLDMNYAYGVEFVEVDPVALGRVKFERTKDLGWAKLIERLEVDPSLYRGLHGTAILSRYQLENVRLIPFDHQGYDWYGEEKDGVSNIEMGKRGASERIFLEKVTREVRRGGRMMLMADISDPDIPTGKMTIVATHLEARTAPDNRLKQLKELLSQIKEIEHPVVVAGDMNTSTGDMTPTSIRREIIKRLGSRNFWVRQGIKYATGAGLLIDLVIDGINFARTQTDPTVANIPFVVPNPEAGFFRELKDFRFSEGSAFDFRGDRKRSAGRHSATLANSNQRADKGFVETYKVSRTIGPAGKFKLDWIFVKPGTITHPDRKNQPFRFSPHFGRTLAALNDCMEGGISDHNPILMDLPFDEPKIR